MKLLIKKNLNLFTNVIEIASQLNDEVPVLFTSTGVHLRCVDRSNIMLLLFDIDKELFDEYVLEKDTSFNIDLQIFLKILKSMKKEMTMSESETELIFSNNKNITRSIKKYVVVDDDRPVPQIEYSNVVKINSEEFMDTLGTILEASTIVNLKLDNNKMILNGKGLKENIEVVLDVNTNIQHSIWVSGDYLYKIKNISNLDENVDLYIEGHNPLKVSFSNSLIKLNGWLALRSADG